MIRPTPTLTALFLSAALSFAGASAAAEQLMIESYTSNGEVQLYNGKGQRKGVAAVKELPQPTAVLDQARAGKLLRIDYQDDDTWIRSLNANLSRTATVDSKVECRVVQAGQPTVALRGQAGNVIRGLNDCD